MTMKGSTNEIIHEKIDNIQKNVFKNENKPCFEIIVTGYTKI